MGTVKTDLGKHIRRVASKLLNEGLTANTYTKTKAKAATKNVVAPVYVHKIIDAFSAEIKAEMVKMRKTKK